MISPKMSCAMGLMRTIRMTARATLLFALAACGPIYGEPTGYTKSDPAWTTKYGYSEKNIGNDEYSVVVTGNPLTSKKRVADIALLRAAYITQEKGRTHFVIMHQTTTDLATQEMISAPLGGLLVWLPVGERQTNEPHAVLLIKLLPKEGVPTHDALEAAAAIEEVGQRLSEEEK